MDSDDVYQKLMEAGIRFVSFRPRSQHEINKQLKKKIRTYGVDDDGLIQRVTDRLTELGYVDDKNFVSWWIQQRSTFKPKGSRLLAQELKAKGVKESTIAEIFSKRELSSDVDLAHKAIHKKLSVWGKLPDLEKKKKLFGYLSSRGFSVSVIYRVIDEVVPIEYNTNDI